MTKRQFRNRKQVDPKDASYPTLDGFDESRRGFLARLGAVVLGATTLAAGLGACGSREPKNVGPAGVPRVPDARADMEPDGQYTLGVAPMPDAQVDAGPSKKDITPAPGFAPPMDALVDGNP